MQEINPSTLSGAIDVIVVERRTPSTSTDGTFETYLEETELVCTPFHVRFGKLSVLRPSDRRVVVRVNGKEVPLAMKVAETGEAFFVFETDDSELPEEMQTSPLARPVRDNPSLEPEPLDLDGTLGTSATSASKRPQEKESKLHNQDGKDLSDASKGGTAFATRMAAKATEVGSAAASEAISATGDHLPKISQSRNQQGSDNDLDQSDAAHLTQHQSSVSAEVKQLERQLESQIRLDAPSASPVGSDNDPGAEVRREAKREESLFPEQECQRLDRSNRPSDTEMEAILKETINTMKNNHSTSHLLNLDMEGYKVGSEQQSEANSIENHVLSRELGGQNLGRDVLRFTQSLLRSADLEKSRHGAEVLTTCGQSPRSSTYATPKPKSESMFRSKSPKFPI